MSEPLRLDADSPSVTGSVFLCVRAESPSRCVNDGHGIAWPLAGTKWASRACWSFTGSTSEARGCELPTKWGRRERPEVARQDRSDARPLLRDHRHHQVPAGSDRRNPPRRLTTAFGAHPVTTAPAGTHPIVGDLTVNYEAMELVADPSLTMSVYTAWPLVFELVGLFVEHLRITEVLYGFKSPLFRPRAPAVHHAGDRFWGQVTGRTWTRVPTVVFPQCSLARAGFVPCGRRRNTAFIAARPVGRARPVRRRPSRGWRSRLARGRARSRASRC